MARARADSQLQITQEDIDINYPVGPIAIQGVLCTHKKLSASLNQIQSVQSFVILFIEKGKESNINHFWAREPSLL